MLKAEPFKSMRQYGITPTSRCEFGVKKMFWTSGAMTKKGTSQVHEMRGYMVKRGSRPVKT